jgi:iduronate 2-sulfatase
MGNYSHVCAPRPAAGAGGNASWSSIPQHFRRHDYTTVGAGKIFQPGAPPEHDQRYSWTENYTYYRHIDYCQRLASDPAHQVDFCDQPDTACIDRWLTDDTLTSLARLTEANGSNSPRHPPPWFLSVGWHKPHPPWPIPKRFTDQYPAAAQIPLATHRAFSRSAPELAFYSARDLNAGHEFAGQNRTISRSAVPAKLAGTMRRAYYGAVAW